ncbi:MAG: TrkH family potassium uptake protein [Thermoplasmata archaeon]
MRILAVAKALGLLLVLFSLSLIPPALLGFRSGEPVGELALEFGAPAAFSAALGAALALVGRRGDELRDREAFVTVALAWLVVSGIGSLPYLASGALPDPVDAFFESASGFTTTGATVVPRPEALPRSVLLWRAETQLIGGMGIIVLSMVVLSRLVGGSTQLFRAEAFALTSFRIRPTMRQIAGTLWTIYLGFVALETLLLWLAGMDPFEAVCHSFSTLSTGGFSTRSAGLAAFNSSPLIGAVVTLFMVIGGTNFVLHYQFLSGKARSALRNPELLGYLILIASASAVTAVMLAIQSGDYSTYRELGGHATFQVVSILTTTGFTTADYAAWPATVQLLLLFLMLVGACSGSTTGALKVIRFIVLLKMVKRELYKAIHPRAVIPLSIGGRPIPTEVMRNVVAYFFVYVTAFFAIALGLGLAGMGLVEALSTSASSLGNVGPALGAYGPTASYAPLHAAGKLLMCFAMWMGRLEIYPALLLLSPSAYKH